MARVRTGSARTVSVARDLLQRFSEATADDQEFIDLLAMPAVYDRQAIRWVQLLKDMQAYLKDPEPPIPVLLFCPRCDTQHIDAPDASRNWTDPPHKSHLCLSCKTIWRPADVPTRGVASLLSEGAHDTWKVEDGVATAARSLLVEAEAKMRHAQDRFRS